MEELLKVKDVVKLTGFSEEWIRRLVRQHKILAHKKGNCLYIVPDTLQAYLSNRPTGKPRGRKKKGA